MQLKHITKGILRWSTRHLHLKNCELNSDPPSFLSDLDTLFASNTSFDLIGGRRLVENRSAKALEWQQKRAKNGWKTGRRKVEEGLKIG